MPRSFKLEIFFKEARNYTRRNWPSELKYFRKLSRATFHDMSPDDFLEEYAWVVYAAGFKEAILERKFPAIKKAFRRFSVNYVRTMSNLRPVLKVFNYERKARNIIEGARMISEEGFANFKQRAEKGGPKVLDELPGIGPATRNQLARNVGLADVAKPDRWIIRVTKLFKFHSYKKMIEHLSGKFKENYGVVDLILFRFCAGKFKKASDLADYVRAPAIPHTAPNRHTRRERAH